MPDLTIQTRHADGELKYHKTLDEAFTYAMNNHGVWKVSFNALNGERVRMIRTEDGWVYENLETCNRYI